MSETFEVEREGVIFVCKRLTGRMRGNQEAREAIRVEGELLAKLEGRGAPKVVARGDDANGPYVVMERSGFATLRQSAARDREWIALGVRSSFRALAEVHEARDEAGALAIVHGDLSPDNVAIEDDARTAIFFDFGLAQYRDTRRSSAAFRGTLLYAAPETARGEAIDARADIFSLAASWLHVISGERPRAEVEEAPMLMAVAEESIETFARRATRDLTPPIAEFLVRCVAFDRDARPRGRSVP